MVFTCLTYLSQKIHVTFKQFLSSVPITLCAQLCFTIVSSMAAAAVNALSDLPPDFFLHLLHICICEKTSSAVWSFRQVNSKYMKSDRF